jgi:hypothetical protein
MDKVYKRKSLINHFWDKIAPLTRTTNINNLPSAFCRARFWVVVDVEVVVAVVVVELEVVVVLVLVVEVVEVVDVVVVDEVVLVVVVLVVVVGILLCGNRNSRMI